MDGPPFAGSWEAFAGGGGGNSSAETGTNPLSGAASLELFLDTGSGFAGVFQDIPAFAGRDVTWSGWHALGSGSTPGGTEIRIEWFDAGGGGLGATPNFTPTLTADNIYVPFSLTATAPAGTATARVVYAIQSFGAGVPQTVFVDDVSGTAIPEPTSLVLAGLAGVGLLAYSRRKK